MSTSSKLIPCSPPEFDALPCKNTPDTSPLGILHVRQIPLLLLATVGTVLSRSYAPKLPLTTCHARHFQHPIPSVYSFERTKSINHHSLRRCSSPRLV